ncbi:class I SAM-dependent methyltransferase [Rarobacter faecitabidus]|uniref:Methyltransferase family protein n=1 Tax=Rarobacter faecitabidus TaxID=13243 RepID=A0A542ZWS1_RARFA|nr:methyltransferase [Rarobacter faecitabidus]TQL64640.1 methyltransferase family protein [Rarobacter faecitabidus]
MSINEGKPEHSHYFTAMAPAAESEIEYREVTLGPFHTRVATARGVFSHEHLDIGTSILLRTVDELEAPLTFQSAADVGCGWGAIALYLALARKNAVDGAGETQPWRVVAADINDRALDLTRRNASIHALPQIEPMRAEDPSARDSFDLIVSNPPIRIGKAALHGILTAWLPRLRVGGAAYLVVAKHLGADSLQRWLTEQFAPGSGSMLSAEGVPVSGEVGRVQTAKGFRILRVRRNA